MSWWYMQSRNGKSGIKLGMVADIKYLYDYMTFIKNCYAVSSQMAFRVNPWVLAGTALKEIGIAAIR